MASLRFSRLCPTKAPPLALLRISWQGHPFYCIVALRKWPGIGCRHCAKGWANVAWTGWATATPKTTDIARALKKGKRLPEASLARAIPGFWHVSASDDDGPDGEEPLAFIRTKGPSFALSSRWSTSLRIHHFC